MNKKRRAAISELVAKLEDLKSDLESIQSEEQDYLDNFPENLQTSERYAAAENSIEAMEWALDNFNELLDNLTMATPD